MTTNKTLRGECSHCGLPFEFPAEVAGTTGECPHCHQQTDFFLVTPETESDASHKLMVWTIVGIALLIAALLAGIFAVHMAKKLKEKKQQRSSQVGTVRMENKMVHYGSF